MGMPVYEVKEEVSSPAADPALPAGRDRTLSLVRETGSTTYPTSVFREENGCFREHHEDGGLSKVRKISDDEGICKIAW